MIRAVLFDWGGVMSDGGRGGELASRLATYLNITADTAQGFINLIWEDYIRGKIAEPELWSRIEAKYGASIADEHRKIWNAWKDTSLIPEMGDLIQELRVAGYRVGVVSNTIPNTASEIRNHGGYAIFDFAVLSFEVGVAKPDEAIYSLALNKLGGIPAEEVIFVDDQERCLVPARTLGMKTVLAKNVPQTIHDVRMLLDRLPEPA